MSSDRQTFRDLFDSTIQERTVRLQERANHLRLRQRDDRLRKSRVSLGQQRIQKIRDILGHFDANGWERGRHQRSFHEAFLRASVVRIFADDVSVNMNQVMRDNGWTDIKQYCVVMTPRRCGKTVSVSMFSAAFGIAVPGTEQSLYSTCSRASKALLDMVRRFLDITNMVSIKKCNQEDLFFTLHGSTLLTKIHCYPGNPEVWRMWLFCVVVVVVVFVWLFLCCCGCGVLFPCFFFGFFAVAMDTQWLAFGKFIFKRNESKYRPQNGIGKTTLTSVPRCQLRRWINMINVNFMRK